VRTTLDATSAAADHQDGILVDELARATVAERRSPSTARSRRALDLALSVPAAILTFPVVLAIALVSAWTFRAWPFFVQTRVGLDGRPFRFVKVRSLPIETPEYADKYAIRHGQNRWSTLIRRTHLDELPQLWHVVRGQMSLVGPRPEMVPLSGRFDAGFAAARVGTPPGCTGIWQVSATNDRLIGEAPEYDLFYLRHASRRLDLWVLWRTFLGLVPGADRRIGFDDVPSRFCRIAPEEIQHYADLRLPPAWRQRDQGRAVAPSPVPTELVPNVAMTGLTNTESVGSPS
jgi:lipopolysaccharide/colanic/teichoic acid biosynthesis glycosyltransferase